MKHKSIGDVIATIIDARKSKQLSQSEVGRRLGLPQSYISRLESGRLDVRLTSLIDIARFLELELMLIPSSMVPTIQSLTGGGLAIEADGPLYTLDDFGDTN